MTKIQNSSSAIRMDRWLTAKYKKGTIQSIHKLIPAMASKRELPATKIAGFHLQLAMALANAPDSQYHRLVRTVERASRIGFQALERQAANRKPS